MKQKNLTKKSKMIPSQNNLGTRISFLASSFIALTFSVITTPSLSASLKNTDKSLLPPTTALQLRMLEKPLSQSKASKEDILKKYGLVRLWPLNSESYLADDRILGSSLVNKSFRVEPFYSSGNIYAKFDSKSMISSDESLFFQDYFSENKPSSLDTDVFKIKKGLSKASEWFPNYIPSISPEQKNGLKQSLLEKYKDKIQYSSSMISVEKKNDKYYLKNTDYTIGGWIKPQRFTKSDFRQEKMILFSKKFTNLNGFNVIKEWEISMAGNVIFFHNFHDNSQPVAIKYLNTEQTELFRIQNKNFYGMYDYYDDVVERTQNTLFIDKYILPPILPNTKNVVRKPIAIIPPIPVTPPPGIARPMVIPQPVPPPYIVIPPTGKDYTSNVDLKTFWHATVLGSCYSCQVEGQHSDVWHYISFSVHLNDPLGPYVDFWIIMDPNPRYFKGTATYANHAKHLRWELDKQILSQPVLNPFMNGIEIDRECSKTSPEEFQKGTCLKSVFEIGSLDQENGFSGFMRGIYLSKKALREKEVLDLAAQFYPNDSIHLRTYEHSPKD